MSVQQAQDGSKLVQSATADREVKERQIRELQQQQEECNEQIQDLRQQLEVSNGCIQEKDAAITAIQQEIQQLQQITLEKDHVIEAREGQLRELNQQLTASEQVTAQFQQNPQREKIIQELQEEIQHLQQQLDEQPMGTWTEKLTLKWKTCKTAPRRMYKGSATVHGRIACFRPVLSRLVHSYNPATEVWSTLPVRPGDHFTLTVVNDL